MLPENEQAAGNDRDNAEIGSGGFLARMKRVWKEAKEKAERENCRVCKLERSRGNFEECSGHDCSGRNSGVLLLGD